MGLFGKSKKEREKEYMNRLDVPLCLKEDFELIITKYHRTLTTYLNTLLSNSFIINQIVEPQPPENMMDIPGMADEMRRPMMLIVSAKKKM